MVSTVHLVRWACKLNERKKWVTADARTMIDDNTTKDTMGWMDRVRMSCWVWGGFEGEGSWWTARVEMKIAPTPIYRSSQKIVSLTYAVWQLTGPIQKLERYVYQEMMYAPKWPQKRASRHEVISGIHLYNTKMAGIRRKNSIPQVNTSSRHGIISRSGIVNALNDNHAPI